MIGIAPLALVGALGGCNPIPKSIPRKPGTFGSEKDIRRAWLSASPDNAVGPYFVISTLAAIGDGQCPEVENTDDGREYKGQGCTDSYGITWLGEFEETEDEDGVNLVDWFEFGAETAGTSWTMTGRMTWEFVNGADLSITQAAALDYSGNSDSFEAWQDLALDLQWNDGDYRLNELSGEIGVEDWGLAQVDNSGKIYLGRALNCDYPSGGGLEIEGENTAELDFGSHEAGVCNDCPGWTMGGQEQDPICGPLHELSVVVGED